LLTEWINNVRGDLDTALCILDTLPHG